MPPSDWAEHTIGDLVEFQGGSQPPKSVFARTPQPGYVRLIQIQDYRTDKRATYIPASESKRWCETDDVMIGRYGPPIFQILRGLQGSYNVALIKATPKPEISKTYLYYYLSLPSLFQLIDNLSRRSAGQAGVDMAALRHYPFPIPPKPERDRIERILVTFDLQIEQVSRVLKLKRRLKRGLMQQLLTGHRRFPQFGNHPWREVRLRDVTEACSVRNKGTLGRDSVQAVTKASGMIPMKPETIAGSIERYQIVQRDWFSYNPMRLNIGSIARWSGASNVLVSPDYVVFRCKAAELDPDFLDQFRRSHIWTSFMGACGNGSVRVRIWFDDLGVLKLKLPTLSEQRRIAAVLTTADREIELLEQQLAALRAQKKGLMQKLLTGEVRVKVSLKKEDSMSTALHAGDHP